MYSKKSKQHYTLSSQFSRGIKRTFGMGPGYVGEFRADIELKHRVIGSKGRREKHQLLLGKMNRSLNPRNFV